MGSQRTFDHYITKFATQVNSLAFPSVCPFGDSEHCGGLGYLQNRLGRFEDKRPSLVCARLLAVGGEGYFHQYGKTHGGFVGIADADAEIAAV